MNISLAKAIKHWPHIATIATYPKNKKDYEAMVEKLDELLDIVGSNEEHPLIGLVDLLSSHISAYEEKHIQEPMGKGIDALKFLLEAHPLKQNELSHIASQGVMS